MPLKAGDAFFKSGTGGFRNPGGGHLCVCLTSPCDKDDILTVTIQTYHPGFDTSCILNVGDHESIQHKSIATYARATKVGAKATQALIDNKTYTQKASVSPAILKKLRDGLKASGDTPPFALDYAKKRGI